MVSHAVWTALALLAGCALTSCGTDDSDNKPYKFGFNIEKYQHRLEEKNKKGLIKGEFGFVTGDGVYHETAYATDEKGDFKILGMRSYFVGLPGLDLPDITKGSKPAAPPAPAPKPLAPTILSGIMGCGSCTIPNSAAAGAAQQSGTGPNPASPGNNGNGPFSRPPSAFGGPGGPGGSAGGPGGVSGSTAATADRNPQGKPTYTHVDGGHSNIKVGGFTPEEMLALLYRFNYTLGFHGHHEVGDRAGHKQGGYHFDGRDGQERRVQYTANEYGFQPNITLHQLSAADTPRADTERNAEHGLKGYEFVWFNDKKRAAHLGAAAAASRS